jgi:hypothetical protein
MMFAIYLRDSFSKQKFGANMGDVIRFTPKSERVRARLIREARAIYDSIFSPADLASELRNKPPASHTVGGTNFCCDPGGYNLHSNLASSGELRGAIDHRSGAMGTSAMLAFPTRETALDEAKRRCLNLTNTGSR